MLKIDGKAIAVGAMASLAALAVWELVGRSVVERIKAGNDNAEAGESVSV